MRTLIFATLILGMLALAGCPAGSNKQPDTKPAAAKPSQTVRALTTKLNRPYPLEKVEASAFPPEAVAYLEESLANLSSKEHPPKDMTLTAIGMLSGCQVGRDAVLHEVELSGETLSPTAAAAYLSAAPEDCLAFIRRKVMAGDRRLLTTIGYNADVAIWVMEHLDLETADDAENLFIMSGILTWGLDHEKYLDNLKSLMASDDQSARMIAQGLSIRLGLGNDETRNSLIDALNGGDIITFATAAEAIRLSNDQGFIEYFKPYLEGEGKLDLNSPDEERLSYLANALSTMEGPVARDLRLKLFECNQTHVRWVAAIGELLNGEPKYWDTMVAESTADDPAFWAALWSPDTRHEGVLNGLYKRMGNKAQNERYRAVDALSVYLDYAENETLHKIVRKGTKDESPMVRERSWQIAAMVCPQYFVEEALETLQDTEEPPKVRIAATTCAMKPAILRANGKLDKE